MNRNIGWERGERELRRGVHRKEGGREREGGGKGGREREGEGGREEEGYS